MSRALAVNPKCTYRGDLAASKCYKKVSTTEKTSASSRQCGGVFLCPHASQKSTPPGSKYDVPVAPVLNWPMQCPAMAMVARRVPSRCDVTWPTLFPPSLGLAVHPGAEQREGNNAGSGDQERKNSYCPHGPHSRTVCKVCAGSSFGLKFNGAVSILSV